MSRSPIATTARTWTSGAPSNSEPQPPAHPIVRLTREPEPLDVVDYLRWFIDNDVPPTGSGPNGLADFCQQATTYWEARNAPNVHLFHYTDLWENLAGEMRLVADALDITVDEARWPEFVEAATLDSMRDRAADTAPDAHVALWRDPHTFFRSGGYREWASLLTDSDIERFNERLGALTRDATPWVLTGRAGLPD